MQSQAPCEDFFTVKFSPPPATRVRQGSADTGASLYGGKAHRSKLSAKSGMETSMPLLLLNRACRGSRHALRSFYRSSRKYARPSDAGG